MKMRRDVFLSFILLTFFCLFTGCKKDCEEPSGYLTVGNTTYAVDKLAFYHITSTGSGDVYYVDLVTPGIKIDDNGDFLNTGITVL